MNNPPKKNPKSPKKPPKKIIALGIECKLVSKFGETSYHGEDERYEIDAYTGPFAPDDDQCAVNIKLKRFCHHVEYQGSGATINAAIEMALEHYIEGDLELYKKYVQDMQARLSEQS